MNISVFCGASLPRNKEIVEAAAVLGRRIAQEGHNLGLMSAASFRTETTPRSRAR